MELKIMFSGWLWLLPFMLGVSIVVWGLFLSFFARRRSWTRRKRLHQLRLGRSLIPILPLAGIFGTVYGLMDTLVYMRDKTGDKFDVTGVVERYAVALNTTFWGIIFALFAIVIFEAQIRQMEEVEDESENA